MIQVKKVSSSHIKKQTVIIAEQDIPEQGLKDVVAKVGYDAVSVGRGVVSVKDRQHIEENKLATTGVYGLVRNPISVENIAFYGH